MSTRRKIELLRALAASTRFPEEAQSARDKADKLEAELKPQATPDTIAVEALYEMIKQAQSAMNATTGVQDHMADSMLYAMG